MKMIILVIMLALSSSCMRAPLPVTYNGEAFRLAVQERVGHSLLPKEPIIISGGKGMDVTVTAESIMAPPFQLSPEAREDLRPCVNMASTQWERFDGLYDCLFCSSSRFTYITDSTLSADACFKSHEGNCFAMTNLLIGAARYAGLHAYYMLVEDIVGNKVEANVVVHTNHIITAVQIGQDRRMVDFIPNTRHYYYVTLLSDIEAAGLYYNNLAAQLLLQHQDKKAEILFHIAEKLYPDSYQIQDNLGTLMLRKGNRLGARKHFLKALELARFPDLVMGNILKVFERRGDTELLNMLHKDIRRVKQRNPYFYLSLASRDYWRRDYKTAIKLCETARGIREDIPEIYLLEFRIYAKLGLKKQQMKAYKQLLKYEHYDKEAPPMPKVVDPPKSSGWGIIPDKFVDTNPDK